MKNRRLTTKARRHEEDLMVSKLINNVLEFSFHSFALFNFVPLCLCGKRYFIEATI